MKNFKTTIRFIALLLIIAMLGLTWQDKASAYNTMPSQVSHEILIVSNQLTDNMQVAYSINPNSDLKHGYLLDNKYTIGDVVHIVFHHDDVYHEQFIFNMFGGSLVLPLFFVFSLNAIY